MLDKPPAELIIAEVRNALDDGMKPGFEQKVAANALGIASRELFEWPEKAALEAERLNSLVGSEGGLAERNHHFATLIRNGDWPVEKDVISHLILTSIEKMEVDQPAYPAFRQWKEGR